MNGNKMKSLAVVLLMLSVTFSIGIGGLLNGASASEGGPAPFKDMEISDTGEGYTVTGDIEIEIYGIEFNQLKVVLRDYELRKNYTTYVDAYGDYLFSDIPYTDNGEYGLYVFGGNNVIFRAVNLDDAEGRVFKIDKITLDRRDSGISIPDIDAETESGSLKYRITIYENHNTANLTPVSSNATVADGKLLLPEIIEHNGRKYAIAELTANFAIIRTIPIVIFPFGLESLVSGTGVQTIFNTFIIPSSVTTLPNGFINQGSQISKVVLE